MRNLKNNGTNELTYKRVIGAESKLTVTRGKWGRGVTQEFGSDISTLLYIQ